MTTTTLSRAAAGRSAAARWDRLGGLGGLVFVTSVIAQNVIRAAIDPAPDASAAKVTSFVTDNRGLLEAMFGLFLVNMACLAAFVGTVYHRTAQGPMGWAAGAGLIGAGTIIMFFSMNVAVEAALTVRSSALLDQPQLTEMLWSLHSVLFAMNFAALATALAGFSVASAASGLVPRWFRIAGPAGAVLLLVSSTGVVPAADGNMAVMGIGLPGFIVWLLWMAVAGYRIATTPAADA